MIIIQRLSKNDKPVCPVCAKNLENEETNYYDWYTCGEGYGEHRSRVNPVPYPHDLVLLIPFIQEEPLTDGIHSLGSKHVNLIATTAYLALEEHYHYYGENLPEITPYPDRLEEGIEEWWVLVKQGEVISFLKTENMWNDFPGHVCPIALTAYTFIGHRNQGYSKKVIKAFLEGKNSFIFCGYNGHSKWIKKFFNMFCNWGWEPVQQQGENYLMKK
ncbi:MAG: hypothetical protein ACFFD4_38005 [Candidatus Odinarchaeota archaeon]